MSQPKTITINLDSRLLSKVTRYAAVLFGLTLLLLILPTLGTVFGILTASILLSIALNPLANIFERNGISRIGAIIIVYALLLLTIALMLQLLSPAISTQFEQLARSMQGNESTQLKNMLQESIAKNIPLLESPQIKQLASERASTFINNILQFSFSAMTALLTSYLHYIIIAFSTFFFLKDGWRIKGSIVEAMPNRYFEISIILLHKISRRLHHYIRGQLLVSLTIGLLATLSLAWLDVPFSIFIGALVSLSHMIPYFGPILGFILAVSISLTAAPGPGTILAIAAAFATIQLLDNLLLSPLVQSRAAELHPIIIIVALLAGHALMGPPGMFLAVPVARIFKIIFTVLRWGKQNYKDQERKLHMETVSQLNY